MESIRFISHCTEDFIDDIKTAVLYFNQIEIPVYEELWAQYETPVDPITKTARAKLFFKSYFKDPTYFQHIKPFMDEKIIRIYIEPSYSKKKKETKDSSTGTIVIGESVNNLGDLIDNEIGLLFKKGSFQREDIDQKRRSFSFSGDLINEAELIVKRLFPLSDLSCNDKNQLVFILTYYAQLVISLIKSIGCGEYCLTTSKLTSDWFKAYTLLQQVKETRIKLENELDINPSIAFEAIKLALPDVSRLSSEDILEIRFRLKDELLAFQNYMRSMQLDFEQNFSSEFIRKKSNEIVKYKIKPSLDDLIHKFSDLKLSISSSLLNQIKDPKSYSPLLLTLTDEISSTGVLLCSLGLISINTAIEIYRKKKEIKRNGLYYLLQLKKRYSNKE